MGVEAVPPVPILQALDEIEGVRARGRLAHLGLARLGPAVADVVADRPMQQRRVLRHHRDVAAQALLGHMRDVLAVDQDATALEFIEAQQQIDERRFPRAGPPDQTDALARSDREIDAVEHAACGAVAEPDILETDPALLDPQRCCVRPVGHLMGDRDRAHAVLHDADILEDRRYVLRDPARDIGDLPGERQRHCDRADRDRSAVPEPHGDRAGANHHRGVERRERQAEECDQAQLSPEGPRVLVDRRAYEVVLVARPREQLHRENIRVAVHHAARERRAHLGHLPRPIAQARHEKAQEDRIARKPQEHRRREPDIAACHQDDSAGAVDQDVPDRIRAGDHALAERRARLHDAVGDPPREIVLEERPALPHHVPVALPADQVRETGGDRLVRDQALQQKGTRPHQQEDERHAKELRPGLRQQRARRMVRDQRHHAPDEDRDRRVERSHHEAREEQRHHQPARLPRVMPIKRRKPRRRRGVGRERGRLQ